MFRTNLQSASARMASILLLALVVILTVSAQAQTFTLLHIFTDGSDGAKPTGGVTIGGAGTLYGTASEGGITGSCSGFGCGVAFKLSHSGSGWTLDPLHEFGGPPNDGSGPAAALVIGPDGALYGTTYGGGTGQCTDGCGTVFVLRPPAIACKTAICSWSETLLYSFQGGANDGANPAGNLIFDRAGNIYGTTANGGSGGCLYGSCGTVFELTPSGDGTWTETILHYFSNNGTDGNGPGAGVILDAAGSIYGTTVYGGTAQGLGCDDGCGTVFELTPSNGTWTESILFSFYLGDDGASPDALIMDQSGNLYGTAYVDESGGGNVFELTPSNGGWAFSTLYLFSECSPEGGLTTDTAGNLHGTCPVGGAYGYGTVFELTNSSGFWTLTDVHSFDGESGGGHPVAGVVFDSSGNLYGTTALGGNLSNCIDGCGTVWELTP
jgi:hypothetical protein